jgi:hypothetical protein
MRQNQQMTIDDVLAIVGAKEVEIISLRRQLAEERADNAKQKEAAKEPGLSGNEEK